MEAVWSLGAVLCAVGPPTYFRQFANRSTVLHHRPADCLHPVPLLYRLFVSPGTHTLNSKPLNVTMCRCEEGGIGRTLGFSESGGWVPLRGSGPLEKRAKLRLCCGKTPQGGSCLGARKSRKRAPTRSQICLRFDVKLPAPRTEKHMPAVSAPQSVTCY